MRASILVAPATSAEPTRRLLASLDRLTTPVSDFDVVFLTSGDHEPPEPLRARLPYRPNVSILAVEDPSDVPAWRHQVRGEYAIGLTVAETLFPRSIDELLRCAGEGEYEAVAGRVVDGRGDVPAALRAEEAEVPPPHGDGLVWMVRADQAQSLVDGRLVPAADARCGGLDSYPIALRHDDGATAAATQSRPLSSSTELSWVGGRLRMTTDVGQAITSARLVLQHIPTFETYVLPAEVGPGHLTRVCAEIDPLTAASGGSLAPGSWAVRLQVGAEQSGLLAFDVASAPSRPALLRSTTVALTGRDRMLLAVGPGPGSFLPPLTADAAEVIESVRGNQLSVSLPGLHCFEAEDLPVKLLIGSVAVPAVVAVRDDEAHLEALVSGVAGTEPLAVRFGSGSDHDLGVSLRADGLGAMTVVATPEAAAPKAAPKPKPAPQPKPAPAPAQRVRPKSKKVPRPQPKGAVAALRRSVQQPIEPLVKRLSRVPALRKAYRILTRSADG